MIQIILTSISIILIMMCGMALIWFAANWSDN